MPHELSKYIHDFIRPDTGINSFEHLHILDSLRYKWIRENMHKGFQVGQVYSCENSYNINERGRIRTFKVIKVGKMISFEDNKGKVYNRKPKPNDTRCWTCWDGRRDFGFFPTNFISYGVEIEHCHILMMNIQRPK